MHASKVAWVGQTFALAKCNESGERKSRIRRSKEERKEMVVSFIKRYQNSNNGSFPSLNLTHKEVGGSFYTVRELVREVIQENRVLGPPKVPPGGQSVDSFLEQYPLGSISVEPTHVYVVQSNGTQIVLDHHQNTNNEKVLHSTHTHDRGFHDEKIVNGSSNISVPMENLEQPIYQEYMVGKVAGGKKDEVKEEVYEANISQMPNDLVQEMFPLRPASNTMYDMDGESSGKDVLSQPLEEENTESIKWEAGVNNSRAHDGMDLMAELTGIVDTTTKDNLVGSLQEGNTILMDEKGDARVENQNHSISKESIALEVKSSIDNELHDGMDLLADMSGIVGTKTETDRAGSLPEGNTILMDKKADATLGSRNHSVTKESIVPKVNSSIDNELEDNLPARNKFANAPYGSKGRSLQQSRFVEAKANQKQPDIHHGPSLEKKRTDPTVDRINLKSWEATSEKPPGQAPNSLLAFLNAVITAFIKFWSE